MIENDPFPRNSNLICENQKNSNNYLPVASGEVVASNNSTYDAVIFWYNNDNSKNNSITD